MHDIDGDNIEQLVPGSRHALIAAAQNGHLDIVEYLLDTAELIVSLPGVLVASFMYRNLIKIPCPDRHLFFPARRHLSSHR